MKKRIVILASGTGTNARRLSEYFNDCDYAEVAAVVCDRPAPVVEKVRPLGVKVQMLDRPVWRQDPDAVLSLMRSLGADLIVLAGFLSFIPNEVIDEYPRRIVNIHPSLLPKFGGKGMWGMRVHRAVVEAGEKESGITVHYVSAAVDAGEVIAQFRCPLDPGETPESLADKIHTLEQKHFPEVIDRLVKAM